MNQNSKKEFHHSKKYKILAVLCQIGILLTFFYCIVYEYLFLSLWSSIPLYLKLILIPLLIISYYFYVEGTICFILNKKSIFHIWIRQGITRFFHLSDSNSQIPVVLEKNGSTTQNVVVYPLHFLLQKLLLID